MVCGIEFISYKSFDIVLTFLFLTIRNQIQNIYSGIMKNIYFNYFLVSMGQIVSIFLFLIQKHLSQSLIENKNYNHTKFFFRIPNSSINIFQPNNKELFFFPLHKKKEYYFLIFISSILDLITSLFLYSIGVSIGEIPVFFIFTTLILSKKFLGEIYYKHHYFSLIIISISCFFHIMNDIINESNFDKDKFIYHLIVLFFVSILYGIQVVIQKFLMENQFISPFVLLTHQGFISIILLIILCYILSFFKCNSKNEFLINYRFCHENEQLFTLKKKYFKINSLDILLIFGYFLSSMFYYIMKTLVIYFWTPCHFAVVLSLSELRDIISNIYRILKKKDITLNYVLIDSFTHIIYIFGTFVFCEFIILKFCNLDFHTHNEIHNRNINEVKRMTQNQNNDEFEYDQIDF